VAHYGTFDDMFDHENVSSVNPAATRAEQPANIRLIYPAENRAPATSGRATARLSATSRPDMGCQRPFRRRRRFAHNAYGTTIRGLVKTPRM